MSVSPLVLVFEETPNMDVGLLWVFLFEESPKNGPPHVFKDSIAKQLCHSAS